MAFVEVTDAQTVPIGTTGTADDGTPVDAPNLNDGDTGTTPGEIRAGMACYKVIIDLGFTHADLDNSNFSINIFDGEIMTAAGLCTLYPYIDGNSVHASVSQVVTIVDNGAYDTFLLDSAFVDALADVGTDQVAIRLFATGAGRGRFNNIQVEFSEAAGNEIVLPLRRSLSLVVTGTEPLLDYTIVDPPIDALVLAGQIPILDYTIIDPPIDDLNFTGHIPLLNYTIVDPPIDDLNFTGHIPLSNEEHFRAPAIDDLNFTGHIPTTLQGFSIEVPYIELNLITLTGLRFIGYAPSLDYTIVDPPIDDLVLVGQQPSLDYSIAVPVRPLVLAGQAPIRRRSVNEQDHYRWYANDNTDVDLTTALAAEDTSYDVPLDDLGVSHHLRICHSNTGNQLAQEVYNLLVDVDGGGFNLITAASSNVRVIAGLPTNVDPTDQRLSDGTAASYSIGEYDDENAQIGEDVEADTFTESVFSLEFRSGDLTGGETLTFRLTYNGEEVDTYNVVITATINASITRAPAVRALVLAGQVPILDYTIVDPAIDTLVLAGQAPTPSVHISVPEVDLVLAGQVPTLIRGTVRDPAVRALVLAGQAPTLDYRIVDPPIDDLVLAGQQPSLDYTIVDPPIDDLVLAGKQPSLDYGIAVPRLALVLIGQSVSINYITVPTVALTLTGHIPLIFTGLSPPEADLVLAGQAPTPSIHSSPPVRALVLAGQAPSLNYTIVDPAIDALLLTGQAPTLDYGIVDPAIDDLVLAGQAPTLNYTIVDPAVDALVLAGQVPLSNEAHFKTPAIDALVLAGQAPSVAGDGIVPLTATLALAGQVPNPIDSASPEITVPYLELNLISFSGLQLLGYPPIAVVPVNHFASPPAAALTLTGIQIVNDPVITPAVATLTIKSTSFVALTQSPFVEEPPIGTLVLATQAPTRAFGLLLRGHAVNVSLSAPVINPGSLVLSGQAPTVVDSTPQPHIRLVPDTKRALGSHEFVVELGQEIEDSSLIVEGWAPDSIASSPVFFPAEAPLVLTGQDVGLPNALPLVATVVLAGQAPTALLSVNHFALPAAGGLTLAGQAPGLFADTTLMQPLAGSLTLSGKDTFTGRSITPESKALLLNGKAPTVVVGLNPSITPAVRALTLAGQAPVVNAGLSPIVPAGALTLTGQAVAISGVTSTHVMKPAAAAVSLVGIVPADIIATTSALPPVRLLVLTGQAPTLNQTQTILLGARLRLVDLTTKRNVEILNR